DKQNPSPLEKTTTEDQSEHLIKTSESPAAQTAPDPPLEEPMRTWWMEDDVQPPSAQSQSAAPRWDFSSISFPDLGSRRSHSVSLESPDPCLLPGALEVGGCDLSPWLRKLNVKQEKLERDRYHRDINSDREVRDCRNWAEYLQLVEDRRRRSQKDRPVHLWEKEVTPLTQPGQCTSH
ncbi:hypothetical protein M9458_007094, partial [Cirrhinus mrigala]